LFPGPRPSCGSAGVLGESFNPGFFVSIRQGYTEAGLLRSVLDVTALLTTPIIGYYADKISIKKMMLVGIALYLLVAVNYFLAGALAMVLFVIIARILNGISGR